MDFNSFFNQLTTGIESLAKTSLKEYESQAAADGKALVDEAKASLQQWASEVETGAMTAKDVEYLLLEDADLGKMKALKQAGLAQVRIDEFRNSVINYTIGAITSLVKV